MALVCKLGMYHDFLDHLHHFARVDDGVCDCAQQVEGMRRAVRTDDCVDGYSVSGIDGSVGIALRRCFGHLKSSCDVDFHACGIFAVNGDLYVPRRDFHECADCPLLKPTIATVAIIDAMAFWNDYLLPSLVLAKKELYTIPIATQVFYGTYSTDIGLVMAALLLAMLPILILYIFLQRYIVEGVTSGAVK